MSTHVPTEQTCPQCGKTLEIPLGIINNCQRYFSSPVMRARCCGYGVRLVPHFSITLEAVPRTTRADSLGIALNVDEE